MGRTHKLDGEGGGGKKVTLNAVRTCGKFKNQFLLKKRFKKTKQFAEGGGGEACEKKKFRKDVTNDQTKPLK